MSALNGVTQIVTLLITNLLSPLPLQVGDTIITKLQGVLLQLFRTGASESESLV